MGKKHGAKRKAVVKKAQQRLLLSPTQLRNARKRRSKQKNKQQQRLVLLTKDTPPAASSFRRHSRKINNATQEDPSTQYLSNPHRAPVVKRAQEFFSTKLPLSSFRIHLGPVEGWRTIAKLAVRNCSTVHCTTNKREEQQPRERLLTIGLFQPGTHRLTAIPNNKAHHPAVNRALAAVQRLARKLRISPYDDATGGGSFRNVALYVERSTGAVQVTLVWNGPNDETGDEQSLLTQLCCELIAEGASSADNNNNNNKKGGEKPSFRLHSLWVHYNQSWKHANAIFSHDGPWKKIYGPAYRTEYLDNSSTTSSNDDDHHCFFGGVPLFFPPQVFCQANLDAFGSIVREIRRYMVDYKRDVVASSAGGKTSGRLAKLRCLELYGGVGTIGLHLADLMFSLTSSDENPHNKDCFDRSVRRLPLLSADQKSRIQYQSASAGQMVLQHSKLLRRSDVVVVDPPRKGLEDVVVKALCGRGDGGGPHLLVYVSCGFDAFQRDCQLLMEKGGWTLDRASGYILFPGSDAIETVAFFTR